MTFWTIADFILAMPWWFLPLTYSLGIVVFLAATRSASMTLFTWWLKGTAVLLGASVGLTQGPGLVLALVQSFDGHLTLLWDVIIGNLLALTALALAIIGAWHLRTREEFSFAALGFAVYGISSLAYIFLSRGEPWKSWLGGS